MKLLHQGEKNEQAPYLSFFLGLLFVSSLVYVIPSANASNEGSSHSSSILWNMVPAIAATSGAEQTPPPVTIPPVQMTASYTCENRVAVHSMNDTIHCVFTFRGAIVAEWYRFTNSSWPAGAFIEHFKMLTEHVPDSDANEWLKHYEGGLSMYAHKWWVHEWALEEHPQKGGYYTSHGYSSTAGNWHFTYGEDQTGGSSTQYTTEIWIENTDGSSQSCHGHAGDETFVIVKAERYDNQWQVTPSCDGYSYVWNIPGFTENVAESTFKELVENLLREKFNPIKWHLVNVWPGSWYIARWSAATQWDAPGFISN